MMEDKRPTRRQCEVIHLAGQGMKNREIAQALGIAENTVAQYLKRGSQRLGIDSWQIRGEARFLASEKLKAMDEQVSHDARVLHRSYAPCSLGGI